MKSKDLRTDDNLHINEVRPLSHGFRRASSPKVRACKNSRGRKCDPHWWFVRENHSLLEGTTESPLVPEFTHFIEKWNPIQYNELRKVVFDTLTQHGENVHDLIEDKQARNPGMSYDKASREVVAEAMTDILPDAKFVQELAQNHKTIFRKLLDRLKEFVENLRDYFNSIGYNSAKEANALKEQVGDTVKYLDSIVDLFDRVAVEAVENYQKTVATEEAVQEVQENGTGEEVSHRVDAESPGKVGKEDPGRESGKRESCERRIKEILRQKTVKSDEKSAPGRGRVELRETREAFESRARKDGLMYAEIGGVAIALRVAPESSWSENAKVAAAKLTQYGFEVVVFAGQMHHNHKGVTETSVDGFAFRHAGNLTIFISSELDIDGMETAYHEAFHAARYGMFAKYHEKIANIVASNVDIENESFAQFVSLIGDLYAYTESNVSSGKFEAEIIEEFYAWYVGKTYTTQSGDMQEYMAEFSDVETIKSQIDDVYAQMEANADKAPTGLLGNDTEHGTAEEADPVSKKQKTTPATAESREIPFDKRTISHLNSAQRVFVTEFEGQQYVSDAYMALATNDAGVAYAKAELHAKDMALPDITQKAFRNATTLLTEAPIEAKGGGLTIYEFSVGEKKLRFNKKLFSFIDGGLLYYADYHGGSVIKSVNEDGSVKGYLLGMKINDKTFELTDKKPSKTKSFSKKMQALIDAQAASEAKPVEDENDVQHQSREYLEQKSDRPNRRRALVKGEMVNNFRNALSAEEWRRYYEMVRPDKVNADYYEDGDHIAFSIGSKYILAEMQSNGEFSIKQILQSTRKLSALQQSTIDDYIFKYKGEDYGEEAIADWVSSLIQDDGYEILSEYDQHSGIYNEISFQERLGKKADASLSGETRYNREGILEVPAGSSDGEQHQQRTNTLTDREVLTLAAEQIHVDDLTSAEKDALEIFRKRLSKLEALQTKRAEQGRLYREQQFGTKVDRAKAAETLNRMHVLDSQIQKTSAEVLTVEEKTVLKRVLQKARTVVEQQERQHGQEILKRWRDRRNNADAIKKYRNRLRSDVDELTNWVLHPDNKNVVKHIPDALKNTVLPFLSSINFMSKRSLAGGDHTQADKALMEQMRKLAKVMENTVDIDEMYSNYTDLPPDFVKNLRSFMDAAQEIIDSNSGDFVPVTVSESPVSTYASTFAKLGSKTYTFCKSDGTVLWTFTVNGVFTVTTGVSSVCTEATYSYTIYNSIWHFGSASATCSGNKAIGNGAFDRALFSYVFETKTSEVVLTCDTNGNLS